MNARLVQAIAGVTLVSATGVCGTMLEPILTRTEEAGLRYTDVSVEGAPPFVALGTAIGALRGLIVDFLWIKVNVQKEKGLFYEVMADAELITKLQPRFAAVWAFHGHNMAYNISVATHTPEERWYWVNQGIQLVRNEGIRHNPNDLVLHKDLAFWFSHKIEGYSDDAHLFYKTEFCREWHLLLGPPPEDWQERIAWMQAITDAPDSLAQAEALEPQVREVVTRLRETKTPDGRTLGFEANRTFLDTYGGWHEVKISEAARLRGTEEATRRGNPYFAEFDRVASDPQLQAGWEMLLRHVRKRVLLDEYNMDPQLMLELTRDYGPIDWRNAQAHAFYWSARGQRYGEARTATVEDIYKIINNDRQFLQSMQGLARSGRITFDFFSNDLPARFPEPRWIDTIADQFDVFYAKHYNTRGAGGETFIAFLQNFMASAIRETYRAGERDRAERLLKRLDERFNDPRANPNLRTTRFVGPIEKFVMDELQGELELQPHIAPSEAAAAMRYGYRFGVGRDDAETYQRAVRYVDDIIRIYTGGEHDYETKFGTKRMADLIQSLTTVRETTFIQLLNDPTISMYEKATIWARIDRHDRELRLKTYDDIEGPLRYAFVRHELSRGGRSFDEIFPAPPGLEEYRAQRAAAAAAREGKPPPTGRDVIEGK
jgi:hypothetical protein